MTNSPQNPDAAAADAAASADAAQGQSRYQKLLAFLKSHKISCSSCDPCDCGNECAGALVPLNGDASFRRYYRLKMDARALEELCYRQHCTLHAPEYFTGSVIVVDAPPATQKNHEFFTINHIFTHAHLLVPSIICSDLEQGFMVQEDLGQMLFADKLLEHPECTLTLYKSAINAMTKIAAMPLGFDALERVAMARNRLSAMDAEQKAKLKEHVGRYELDGSELSYLEQLPAFDDAFVRMELEIFTQWCLDKALGLKLSDAEQEMLEQSFTFLSSRIQSQVQVAMHRDFHCRNLMVLPESWPALQTGTGSNDSDESGELHLALLDYQDMVKGPLGYDVASLLYDCYTTLSAEHYKILLEQCTDNYRLNGLLRADYSNEDFERDVKICAIERHLKVLGIFNRLYLRDGKDGYLKELPRVLNYLLQNCKDFKELEGLLHFLEQRVRPLICK